ncbi:hypothetical protein [Natrinema hispanicum]|nr:hypothetical protein [Natrinema hispanicum]
MATLVAVGLTRHMTNTELLMAIIGLLSLTIGAIAFGMMLA